MYQNKSSSHKIGNSNGTPSQSTTNDITYRVNGTGYCGGGASTTGNITGIYDMSGGAWEAVMGYYTGASSTWGTNSTSNDSGFSSAPNEKYYDAYATTSATTACSGGVCYGHALSETLGWYDDYSTFIASSAPWIIRGGRTGYTSTSGVFGYSQGYGGSTNTFSFRVVLIYYENKESGTSGPPV